MQPWSSTNSMSLGQSIRNGVKWLAFGKVGNRLFEFAFGVALARLLVPADFGMIATIHIFTGFVGMFVAGGMGQSLIRAKRVDEGDFTAVFTLQLGVGACVYLGFFAAAPLIARFFDNPLYADLIRVSALTFLLRPLVTLRNAWLNREMNFKSRTLVDVATGFFGGAVSVCLALAGLGVWSLTLSGLIGALFNYAWLARLTPLRLRLNFDTATMRKHAGYGARIVGNDFVDYVRAQTRTLILSKLAGPAFLGLFNKSESLSRLPNQLLMSPTMEPLFRGMSKSQHDVDQIKYLYLRSITLLMAYTAPAYALLWWIAEPFITFVYGEKWTAAGTPMSTLVLVGPLLIVHLPSSVVLAVRNRLTQEMIATAINIPILAFACWFGLRWGLNGVAWGVVIAAAIHAAQLYALVLRALPTRPRELLQAVTPGLLLGGATFVVLAGVHAMVSDRAVGQPLFYLALMSVLGGGFAIAAFLFAPLPSLASESARWRELVLRRLGRASPNADAPTSQPKAPPMIKKAILWLTPLVLLMAGLYSVRVDLAPQAQRLLAREWRSFEADPLPVDTITHIYDMGVTDADNDGLLDLYTANHNYRQYLFRNTGGGHYEDVLTAWKLDQSGSLPGAEQSKTPPRIERPGLYLYWIGDTLHVQAHELERLGPVKGTLRLFNLAQVVSNEGIAITNNVSRAGEMPETRIDFSAARNGHLVLFLLTRGAPMQFHLDAPWARQSTFVGRLGLVPQPFSGMSAADRLADACAHCLSFELTLLDRHSMVWSDFNRDGIPDVFINRGALGGTLRSFPQGVRERVGDELLLSQGPGRFVDRAKELGIEKKDCSGRHVRLVDFDGDGLLDIFINCMDRGSVAGGYPKQLYRQTPAGRFEDVAARVGLDLPDAELVDLVWFDADGDGRIDLFTHEDTGYYLYRRSGERFERQKVHTGPFHRDSVAGLKGNTNDYWQFDGKLSVADFDGDERLDLFVASKRGNVLLANRGDGRFEALALAAAGLPADSVAAAWVDYDNDGRMDLHLVPQGVFRQTPDGRFQATGLLALPAAKYQAAVINWFDRDGDGDLDLVMVLQENASLWRWWDRLYKRGDVKGQDDRFDWPVMAKRNAVSGAHWLQVDLVGPVGNPSGIGAHLVLLAGTRKQVRQIGAHEGAVLSQGHYRAYFGLGEQAAPVLLEVRWPDGKVQTVRDLRVDQRVVVRHPG